LEPSEYDPPFSRRRPSEEDLAVFEEVREHFRHSARPYLSSPVSWLTWALVLPTAALLTHGLAPVAGFAGLLFLWSGAILVGGAVEAVVMFRRGAGGSPLASWALRVQGNLSLLALALSALLLWRDEARALPGLWLLLLGHSFYSLGGLSYTALRRYGATYQAGGFAALFLPDHALLIFAATTLVANLGLGLAVWRRQRRERGASAP